MHIPKCSSFKQVRRYNIPGHAHFLTFSCYNRLPMLTEDSSCAILATSIESACVRLDVALWAYVFMPEHVHLLVLPRRETYRISDFLKAVKQPVSTRVLHKLKKRNASSLLELRVTKLDSQPRFRFWQAGGGHDFNVWSMKKALEKALYCHRNPVTRGLVSDPEDWRWSSYRQLELGLDYENSPRLARWIDRLEEHS
ncbi:MAG: transposase [Thermodesulfobacteriota bacterium]